MKQPPLVSWSQASQRTPIIDVRTPGEFELDHIPGAINCPVLSNEERVRVGTLYRQVGAFEAKRVGAALVARNIANHLQQSFAQCDKHWSPLVYCWRGGNRSGSLTHILRAVGWQASQLEGGYKAFRQQVIADLAAWPAGFRWLVVSGPTGSGKTRLLDALAQQGAQVLNLEELAGHKGSVLGPVPNVQQPAQKMFDSRIWQVLRQFTPSRPVFVEAESKKVGRVQVPDALFAAITNTAPVLQVQVALSERVQFLLGDYAYFVQDTQWLNTQLSYLTSLHGHARVSAWQQLASAGAWPQLVESLLTTHYDPAYSRSTAQLYTGNPSRVLAQVHLPSLDVSVLHQAAHQLIQQHDPHHQPLVHHNGSP